MEKGELIKNKIKEDFAIMREAIKDQGVKVKKLLSLIDNELEHVQKLYATDKIPWPLAQDISVHLSNASESSQALLAVCKERLEVSCPVKENGDMDYHAMFLDMKLVGKYECSLNKWKITLAELNTKLRILGTYLEDRNLNF